MLQEMETIPLSAQINQTASSAVTATIPILSKVLIRFMIVINREASSLRKELSFQTTSARPVLSATAKATIPG